MINLLNKISIPNDWKIELNNNGFFDSLNKPISFLEKELLDNKDISPAIENIFNAFKYCNFESTKVVIFGQDPYFQSGVANGLAFSVNEDQKIPASLKNIYKEINDDVGPSKNKSGCLKSWAKQGVLLLNTALTVEVSKPGSHSNIGWDNFIYDIIKLINNKPNVVFILWGNFAENVDLISQEVSITSKIELKYLCTMSKAIKNRLSILKKLSIEKLNAMQQEAKLDDEQ